MKLETVRVGMVGLGLAANSHFKGYVSHPDAEVVAVCDTDIENAGDFAKEHGIQKIYTDYEAMVQDEEINTVDIATPTFLHVPMTISAAEAGKHIHCEKPFCRSVSEGESACQAVRRSNVKLMVGETYIFIASHMKARELIEAGEIGRPLQIRQRHGPWLRRNRRSDRKPPSNRNWRMSAEKSGGGDYPWIFDHAVHFFATAEYFMQDMKITEVYALTGTCQPAQGHRLHNTYSVPEVDIPIITWKYEDTDCQGVWMRAEGLNGKYDYVHGFSTTIIGECGMIEVLGEGGHNLIWENRQQHLILHRQDRDTHCFRFDQGGDDVWQSDICYYSQGHINQVYHLIDSILNDTKPRYNDEDGVRAVACTLATIQSAQEGRSVSVEEIEPDYTAY